MVAVDVFEDYFKFNMVFYHGYSSSSVYSFEVSFITHFEKTKQYRF